MQNLDKEHYDLRENGEFEQFSSKGFNPQRISRDLIHRVSLLYLFMEY